MSERARSLTDPKLPSKNDLAEGPVCTFSAIQPSLREWLFLPHSGHCLKPVARFQRMKSGHSVLCFGVA
jgi:hypothetical protein